MMASSGEKSRKPPGSSGFIRFIFDLAFWATERAYHKNWYFTIQRAWLIIKGVSELKTGVFTSELMKVII